MLKDFICVRNLTNPRFTSLLAQYSEDSDAESYAN